MYMFHLQKILKKYNIERKGLVHVGAHYGQEYKLYKQLGFKKILFVENVFSNPICKSVIIKCFFCSCRIIAGSDSIILTLTIKIIPLWEIKSL